MGTGGKIEYPRLEPDPTEYRFTEEELKRIETIVKRYPEKRSAVMPVLWMAQEKYGWLPQGAIRLVAETLGLPYSEVYGVATFYTMYLKEKKAEHVIDLCTCYACGECGGRELYEAIKQEYECDAEGVSRDQFFWLREAECLGACDTGPVMQVNNRRYVHSVNMEKFRQVLEWLREGKELPYQRIELSKQK
jgi:NADH-quinone oxidoreductase subunit E